MATHSGILAWEIPWTEESGGVQSMGSQRVGHRGCIPGSPGESGLVSRGRLGSVTQSCLTLCGSMDCSPPGSSVHGVLQARIPEWVAILFSGGFTRPRDQTGASCTAGDLGSVPRSGRSPGEGNGYPLQYSCLENPMDRGAWRATIQGVSKSNVDCSLPGSSVHGVFQTRILEWVPIPFSRGPDCPAVPGCLPSGA